MDDTMTDERYPWESGADYGERMLNERARYDEGYCDYCESEGHTFSACPERDDS